MKMKMKMMLTASTRIRDLQGAELMSKHGINVPKGVAVSSVEEVRKAISDVFPKESELVVKSQILAGGRGLGTFKSGHKGGVHIVKTNEAEDIAGKMLGQVLVTKQTGALGKSVSKYFGTNSFNGTSRLSAVAKSCELSPKLFNFGNMTERRFYSTASKIPNNTKIPVKVRCIIKGASIVSGGEVGRAKVRCILKGCSIISGGRKRVSETITEDDSSFITRWVLGVTIHKSVKSAVQTFDKVSAPYQLVLERFLKFCSAMSITYKVVVFVVAVILGKISIQSVYEVVKQILFISNQMQSKLIDMDAELKKKNAPLQPVGPPQFHWPWPQLQQLFPAPTRELAPLREPKKYF